MGWKPPRNETSIFPEFNSDNKVSNVTKMSVKDLREMNKLAETDNILLDLLQTAYQHYLLVRKLEERSELKQKITFKPKAILPLKPRPY